MQFTLRVKHIFFLALFLLALYFFVSQARFFQSLVYPFAYQDIIMEEAQKNGVEPFLVVAVIWVESGFRESAESAKGARGLMQVMPQTAMWAAEQMGMEDYSHDKLFEPSTNIAIGTWYLGNLFREFDRNPYLVLAAYNGGRGHVSSWLQKGVWDGSREAIEDVPFLETRSYVLKVERVYKRYRHIYPHLESGEKNLIFEEAVACILSH